MTQSRSGLFKTRFKKHNDQQIYQWFCIFDDENKIRQLRTESIVFRWYVLKSITLPTFYHRTNAFFSDPMQQYMLCIEIFNLHTCMKTLNIHGYLKREMHIDQFRANRSVNNWSIRGIVDEEGRLVIDPSSNTVYLLLASKRTRYGCSCSGCCCSLPFADLDCINRQLPLQQRT